MTAIDSESLKKLHDYILIVAQNLHKFCEENKIEYYLMGGTALGAMRHGGFIPWDDDFDVFMDAENYGRFLECADQLIDKEKFYLQPEDSDELPLFFSKLRLNNTLYLEEANIDRQMHQGIFIDIMCLNNAYDNRFLRYIQYTCARLLSAYALQKIGYKTTSVAKKIAMRASKLISLPWIKKGLLHVVRSPNSKPTTYVGHFFGRAPYKNTCFKRSYLSPGRLVPFEEFKFMVPDNVEEYLTVRFGADYMKMPSMEERDKYPIHALDVKFETE